MFEEINECHKIISVFCELKFDEFSFKDIFFSILFHHFYSQLKFYPLICEFIPQSDVYVDFLSTTSYSNYIIIDDLCVFNVHY